MLALPVHLNMLYYKTVLPHIWSSSNFMVIVASNPRQRTYCLAN